MTSKFSKLAMIFLILVSLMVSMAYAEDISIATGGKSGFYHNGMYSIFSQKVKRFSNGEFECERAVEEGTDGTLQNIKLVESGEANIGFAQLGGLITSDANVEVIGVIMYELAHLVAPKKGKVRDVGDLESKNQNSVGINVNSGSMVTFNVFKQNDKDYARAAVMDSPNSSRAISSILRGTLDSFFFVSSPGTKTIQRAKSSGLEFLDVDDSDFNDLKYNGKRLYEFVKVGKKNGYTNKFKTIRIPAVVIANTDWISENPDIFDVLFDATNAAKMDIKSKKKLKYYPKS